VAWEGSGGGVAGEQGWRGKGAARRREQGSGGDVAREWHGGASRGAAPAWQGNRGAARA